MNGPGPDWITSLLLPVHTLAGTEMPILVGIVNTSGGEQLAMRVGPNGRTVIFTSQDIDQLVENLRRMVEAKQQRDEGEV